MEGHHTLFKMELQTVKQNRKVRREMIMSGGVKFCCLNAQVFHLCFEIKDGQKDIADNAIICNN